MKRIILFLTVVFTFGCSADDSTDIRLVFEHENLLNKDVMLINYLDTTFTIGKGSRIDSIFIPSNGKAVKEIDADGKSVIGLVFTGNRIEVKFSDGKFVAFNNPDFRYPKSRDSISLLPINPFLQLYSKGLISGNNRYFKYAVTEELYNLAK